MPKIAVKSLAKMLSEANRGAKEIKLLLAMVAAEGGITAADHLHYAMGSLTNILSSHVIVYERRMALARFDWLVDVGVLERDARGGLSITEDFREFGK